MAHEYPFMPITTEERLDQALDYVAARASELAVVALGRELPIDTVTVFPRSFTEYEVIKKMVQRRGPESSYTSTSTLYVNPSGLEVRGNVIAYLGVGKPREGRDAVGYADFPVSAAEYEVFKTSGSDFVRDMVSVHGQSMLRVTHPEIQDVFGFVVRAEHHS